MTKPKRIIILAACAAMAAALLSACASSGFAVATTENTKRTTSFQEGMLEQAANDLTAINDCWVNMKKNGQGGESCVALSIALRMTSTFLYAFLGKPEMGRVPAAPEEIAQAIVEKGMNFALMKFGIEAVRKVVDSGQAAQAQIASEGITAASKPPLVVDKPVIVTVPAGSAVLPATPVAATP
jgi:hypothetical protein